MEINVRTWNMNYWKGRKGHTAKTIDEKIKWEEYAKKMILNDDFFDVLILQEVSINILRDENIQFGDVDDNNVIHANYRNNDVQKSIIYNFNHYKYLSWGNMIISQHFGKIGNGYLMCESKSSNDTLSYLSCTFLIKSLKEFITVVNVHLQKDFKTGMYYPSLKKITNEIKQLKERLLVENAPILLVGDFNASNKFNSNELENFEKAFLEIKEIGFIDCTENIDLSKRSSMLDYEYQNDYVFINEPYYNHIVDLKIRKDIESEWIDHYPIDFKIKM